MSLDMFHLDVAPTEQDRAELSSYAPADGGLAWREMLTEQDIDAASTTTTSAGCSTPFPAPRLACRSSATCC
ncbi:hypothetical protein ABZ896_12450 [Streptomyces sp. NPDC047072]|uniref:hypothetical protein n=1 Tax=Streptomyces sp. NPDC047072 TaxID=3154809 RepID=UPI0033D6BD8B